MNWQIAAVIVAVILISFGAFVAMQQLEARRRAEQSRDPAALIGSGIGNLVAGIVEAAT